MIALLQLPVWLGSAIAVLGTILIGVVPFVVFRRMLVRDLPPDAGEVAEKVATRIAAMHGIILALVFADAQSTNADLRQEVSKEVTTLEHIANNLQRWDQPKIGAIRNQLAAYIGAVIDTEWSVGPDQLGAAAARRAFNALDLSLLDLQTDTPREQTLRAQMVQDMATLQDHRKARLSLAHRSLPARFWWIALVGFGITVSLFFVFPARPLHIGMLVLYGAYTGLVLYFILALSHPYLGPASIDTTPYQVVLQDEVLNSTD
jgi:hypothetical protein